MDLQFHGANCLTLHTKQARLVVDDNLAELGAKTIAKAGDVALFTTPCDQKPEDAKIIIDQPGEYEVSGVFVYGIAARAHIDEEGQKTATMYKLLVEDTRILITGNVYPELSEEQLEAIGMIDIMFVPVGGNGLTLDATGALQLIKKVDPKLIIPTHYASKALHYPVEQQKLEDALKTLGIEVKETLPKLKLKPGDLSDRMELVVLEAA